MALTDKYASLIEMAHAHGNVTVEDQGDVLHINGTVNDDAAKEALWAEYNRLDPEMRSGDLVMDVQVGGGGQTYTVKAGDSLSKIAGHYPGVTWHQIFEANKDQISDPDLIHPGQVLKIPSNG
ncbi:MAG TPA: LysM peptidoglycan-binding domain-containing protein [Blastocatellia bacterium]|nr:LysM peptidoglycan-binding domain-containing protein [Blastocatellia bacterium]